MTDHWEAVLNPDILRQHFVRSGLFLLAHEMLVNAIVGRLHGFYADRWIAKVGWQEGPRYREKYYLWIPREKKTDGEQASPGCGRWLRLMKPTN